MIQVIEGCQFEVEKGNFSWKYAHRLKDCIGRPSVALSSAQCQSNAGLSDNAGR